MSSSDVAIRDIWQSNFHSRQLIPASLGFLMTLPRDPATMPACSQAVTSDSRE